MEIVLIILPEKESGGECFYWETELNCSARILFRGTFSCKDFILSLHYACTWSGFSIFDIRTSP